MCVNHMAALLDHTWCCMPICTLPTGAVIPRPSAHSTPTVLGSIISRSLSRSSARLCRWRRRFRSRRCFSRCGLFCINQGRLGSLVLGVLLQGCNRGTIQPNASRGSPVNTKHESAMGTPKQSQLHRQRQAAHARPLQAMYHDLCPSPIPAWSCGRGASRCA